MSRTLAQLSELILKRANGGQLTADRLITLRQVDIHILQARDAFAVEDITAKMKAGNGYIDAEYLSTYKNQEILWDNDRDVAYMILPYRPATLPKGKGIYSIRPMQGSNRMNQTEFFALDPGAWFSMPLWMQGHVVYEYMGENRVEFKNMLQSQMAPVLVQMVTSDAPVDRNSPIGVPSYAEDAIVKNVLQLIGVKEFDSVNDQ